MSRRRKAVGLALGLSLTLAGAALASSSPRLYIQNVTLSPHTGSPHGEGGASGAVTICLDPSSNAVAYNFTALTLADRPTKGQIRRGTAGTSVVSFGAPGLIDPNVGEVEWNDSTPSTASAVSQLAKTPRGFYVSVTTRAYPNGALRGRLAGWKRVSSESDAAAECAFS